MVWKEGARERHGVEERVWAAGPAAPRPDTSGFGCQVRVSVGGFVTRDPKPEPSNPKPSRSSPKP